MTTTQNAAYPLETFGPYGPLPNGEGGYQVGDGNLSGTNFINTPTPAAIPAGAATLTAAQVVGGLILGSPGASAAAYTLPLATDLDNALANAKPGSTFDFRIINTTTAGVITVTTNTGWSIGSAGSQGLMTIAAVAGTTQRYRARKTGTGSWALYRIS